MKKKQWLGILVIAGILMVLIFIKIAYFPTLRQRLKSRENLSEIRNDLSGIRVAIYFGHGMDSHSAIALGRAFQWMGCDVEIVDAERRHECRNNCHI